MNHRRLVGIDLGIATAHTVRVLDGEGAVVAKRKARPTRESLAAAEAAALAGCPEQTRMEVVIEPTGPAWLPIAVFFSARGHQVFRVSSQKAADLHRFLSRHAKSNGIDADTLARLPLFDPAGLQPVQLPGAERAALDRRVRATQAELAAHAAQREARYQAVDPAGLARSLPGLADIGGPALAACMGDPARFRHGKQFRCYTGLTPKASETGETDRKGQPMSKAGSSLLRTTLVRAADTARKQDPQLAAIYYLQMTERGKDHLGALCVVAATLAERAWTVMRRGTPYVICDTDGHPVNPAQAKTIIAERWTVPAEVRARRRSKKAGKAPRKSSKGYANGAASPVAPLHLVTSGPSSGSGSV